MVNSGLLHVEEKDSKNLSQKDGYLLTKKGICILIVVVVLLIVTVGLISGYSVSAQVGKNTGDEKTTAIPKTDRPITTTGKVTTGKEPYHNIRLDKNVFPTHYDLFLKVDLHKRTVNGTVKINVKVKIPTSYIFFHANAFNNIEGYVRDKNNKNIPTESKFLYETNHFYVIQTEKNLDSGEYVLFVEFDYELKNNLKGFYYLTYKNYKGETRPVAASQMEPVDARRSFPCFDEPAMKATFTITIAHEKEFIALSNMDINSTKEMDNMIHDEFEISPIMSTYLVVLVVCDFESRNVIADTSRATRMTYYAPKHQMGQLNYAMDVGKRALAYMERFFQVDYPLKKADMIAIPDFEAGAMENWGLITYRSSTLLYDKIESSVFNKHTVNLIISHELAHQWFGNIVTMDWWSDLWLNEGFASYVAYLGVDNTEPDWKVAMQCVRYQYFLNPTDLDLKIIDGIENDDVEDIAGMDFLVIKDYARGLTLDALLTSHPIFVEVKKPSEIDEIFDAISYSKGGSCLSMLHDFVGTEAFQKGLTEYLRKYSYKNAKTKDLFDELTLASFNVGDNVNVTKIMNTWVLQMGFPVINVNKESGGKFTLKQTRFLRDPNPDTSKSKYVSPYGYKWIVPFNYEAYDVSNMSDIKLLETNRTWLNLADGAISGLKDSDDVIIKGNAGQYGFYRVNYEISQWKKFQQVLKSNHTIFDVKDRAGLIYDVFAMANSDRLTFTEAMNLVDYIHLEKDYLPWKAAYDVITSIPELLPKSSKAKENFKKYMLSKVDSLFKFYQLTPQTGHLNRYLQILIASIACGNGHKDCLSKASDLFKKWKQDPVKNPVPGDIRQLVYFYGVYNGGVEEWDFVFEQYHKTNIASEKEHLMLALSATQEDWLLDRYLNYALFNDSLIKSQDVSDVFDYIANENSKGRYHAWNFMKLNWKQISDKYADSFFTMRYIFESVTKGFTTQYELDEMKSFVETKVTNQGSASRIIEQAEEAIKTNIEWIKRNEVPITDWLENAVKKLP